MSERLFIELPKGFEQDGKIGLLNQALEGTKQAANLCEVAQCDMFDKSLVVGLCVAMTSLSIVNKTLRDKGDVQVPL